MAQLVVAAAGAAIGGTLAPGVLFLGVTGAGLGWAAGSIIGAQFGPKQKSSGPRLSDLKVLGTEYGQPIPYVQGYPRVAGQIWWASDRREISTTTEVGKGGGGQEIESFTYEVDLLIGLSENPIAGVARIWSNGKLIWTNHSSSSTASVAASNATELWSRMTVWSGGQNQLPDPTYEAAVGSANAPAYRGRGSVFIEGLQLGSSGQLPNLTFEVSTKLGVATGDDTLAWGITSGISWFAPGGITAFSSGIFQFHLQQWANTYTSSVVKVYRVGYGLAPVEIGSYSVLTNTDIIQLGQTDESGFAQRNSTTLRFYRGVAGTRTDYTLTQAQNHVLCKYGAHLFAAPSAGTVGLHRYAAATGGAATASNTTDLPGYAYCLACDGTYVYAKVASGSIYQFDATTLALVTSFAPPSGADGLAEIYVGGVDNALYCFRLATQLYKRVDGAWVAILTFTRDTAPNGWLYSSLARGGFYDGNLFQMHVTGSGTAVTCGCYEVLATINPQGEDLDDVVSRVCLRSGLSAGQIDVTALAAVTKPVRGLAVAQLGASRSILELLGAAYFFEAVASDKLYFKLRAGASVASIAFADLGAARGEQGSEPLALTLANDYEVAAQVAVTYANVEADYNVDTQYSDRIISGLKTVAAVDLPLGFTAAEAKGIADAMVTDQAASNVTATLALLPMYNRLEPTDVVTVTGWDGSTYRLRIVRRKYASGLLSFDTVIDDATALTSAGVTSSDYAASMDIAAPVETTMQLMDIPLLRDIDDTPGLYVAAKGAATPWPGAKVYSSVNDVDFAEAATITETATFGTCTTTLGDWTGGWVVDETNSVTVNLGSGTASSSTRAAMLADRSINVWLIGNEVIRAITATLQSPGVYTLTGLFRGQRGTEWAMPYHQAAEQAVLLSVTGLRRIAHTEAALGDLLYYRPVTLGRPIGSASSTQYQDNGVSLRPFAPVDARVSRNVDDDLVITWKRRTRSQTSLMGTGGFIVPLGETIEQYQVEITTGIIPLRTVVTTEPSLTYLQTQALEDLGYVPDTLQLRISQYSAAYGYGTPMVASVSVPYPAGGVPAEPGAPPEDPPTPPTPTTIARSNLVCETGSGVLLMRIVAGVPTYYTSSGSSFVATGLPSTAFMIAGANHTYTSFHLGSTFWYMADGGYYNGGWFAISVPSDYSTAPVKYGSAFLPIDPISGTLPIGPDCVGSDGTNVVAIAFDRFVYNLTSWPTWNYVGDLTPHASEVYDTAFAYFPSFRVQPRRLLKTTAGWLLATARGVWRSTDATGQTSWYHCPTISPDRYTGGNTGVIDAAYTSGARAYVAGVRYNATRTALLNFLAISTDSGATWALQNVIQRSAHFMPLGSDVIAIASNGASVAINDGASTAWVEHATVGLVTPMPYNACDPRGSFIFDRGYAGGDVVMTTADGINWSFAT